MHCFACVCFQTAWTCWWYWSLPAQVELKHISGLLVTFTQETLLTPGVAFTDHRAQTQKTCQHIWRQRLNMWSAHSMCSHKTPIRPDSEDSSELQALWSTLNIRKSIKRSYIILSPVSVCVCGCVRVTAIRPSNCETPESYPACSGGSLCGSIADRLTLAYGCVMRVRDREGKKVWDWETCGSSDDFI